VSGTLERLMLIGYSDKGTIAKWFDHFESR
jgi:hypothetical protein